MADQDTVIMEAMPPPTTTTVTRPHTMADTDPLIMPRVTMAIGASYDPLTPTTVARSIAATVIAGDRSSKIAVRSACARPWCDRPTIEGRRKRMADCFY